MRQYNETVSRVNFISPGHEITADFAASEVIDVPRHDGSVVRLHKLRLLCGDELRAAACRMRRGRPAAHRAF